MEPMTLGSPTGSPSVGGGNFLPAFLMGEANVPTTPRSNTLSPSKGRTLAFAQSPPSSNYSRSGSANSPNDLNRSVLQQKTLFGYQQTSPTALPSHNYSISHNASMTGPPTQGLFESLQAEQSFVETPNPVNTSFRPSVQHHQALNQSHQFNQSINDSYLNQSDFNLSRITSPAVGHQQQQHLNTSNYEFRTPTAVNNNHQNDFSTIASPLYHQHQRHSSNNFWITIFGFPQSATAMILSHFAQCGTILEKVFPPQSGNWIHLKFSSRLECDKAINYNERIIGNCLMIGVVYCRDPAIMDKENLADRNSLPVNRVRPLTHAAYKSAQVPTEVAASPSTPKRSSGLVNKAMDMFFGW